MPILGESRLRWIRDTDPDAWADLEQRVDGLLANHHHVDLGGAIDHVSRVGGQRATDLITKWAEDSSFSLNERITAAIAVATIDNERATRIRDKLLTKPDLSRPERHRLEAAFTPTPQPQPPLENLLLRHARTKSDLSKIDRIL